MNTKEKKYRISGLTVLCYVIAALMLVYVCFQVGNTIATINDYYAQYQMKATSTEYITYCVQAAAQPLFYAFVIFMLGMILDAVRRNNKANYRSDEEIEAAREARKEARDAKKFAKGEAAAAKAGNVTTEEKSVEADFAKSLDEELKADEKKTGSKGQGGQRKSGGNRRNSSYNNRSNNGKRNGENGNKSGDNGNKSSDNGNKSSESGNKSGGSGNKNGNNRRNNNRKPASDKAADKTAEKASDKLAEKNEAKAEVKFEAKSEE